MNPLISVTRGWPADTNDLLDIDVKCFEHAWTPDEWSKVRVGAKYILFVATYYGNAVGFCICQDQKDSLEILKIAVKPSFRRRHVSLSLIASVVEAAVYLRVNTISMIVPEHMVYPGEYSIGEWAKAVGFIATSPFLKKHFTAYGEHEDGVQFIRSMQ